MDLVFNEVLHYAEESLSSNNWQLGDSHRQTNPTLNQNFPNPFFQKTKISFDLPRKVYITLKIYDAIGKEISILVNEEKQPGKYSVTFDGRGLSEGIYFYQLQSDNYSETKMMIYKYPLK